MKRLKKDKRWWEIQHQRKLARIKSKRKGRKKRPNRVIVRPDSITILMPETISLYTTGDFHDALPLFREIESAIETRKPIRLNFMQTKEITVAALLKLFSIVDMAYGNVKSINFHDKSLRELLRAVGFLWVTNQIPHQASTKNLIFPIFKGNGPPNSMKAILNKIIELTKISQDGEGLHRLKRALMESILNVHHHAYVDGDDVHMPWWLVAERTPNELYLALLDVGLGIPETLSRTGLEKWRNVVTRYGAGDDAQMIAAAADYGRTKKPKSEGGGYGFADIQRLVEANKAGTLWVFSNSGLFKFFSDGNTETENHKSSIQGTLIQWNVNL